MEEEEAAREFLDWEVLHNSDTCLVNPSDSVENFKELEGIEADSEGMIRSDYFSLDSQERRAMTVSGGDVSEEASVESDNPSWIDPGSETPYETKNLGKPWSDSSSDRSDYRKFSDFDGKNELGFSENAKSQVGFEGIGEIEAQSEYSGKFWSDSGGIGSIPLKFGEFEKAGEMGIGGFEKTRGGSENSGGNGLVMEFGGGGDVESNGCDEGERGEVVEENGNEDGNVAAVGEMKSGGGEEEMRRRAIWWKIPLELLKYCVFRVSPIWSLSVAAALLGFVILGRRLYKMKRKSPSLQLKVTVDDKKVSQFMSRAARLNEAFSVVRRVPVIRPSLPLAGVTPWPVMSLR